jgi:hypothetical protein
MVPPSVAIARCYPSGLTFAGALEISFTGGSKRLFRHRRQGMLSHIDSADSERFRQGERAEYFLPPGVLELGNSYNG